jgi:hypothetical protein
LKIIDTNFDFHADSNGRDPDVFSLTLKKYHKILWSKPLPNGKLFNLQSGVIDAAKKTTGNKCFHHAIKRLVVLRKFRANICTSEDTSTLFFRAINFLG